MGEERTSGQLRPGNGMFFGRRISLFTLLGFQVQLDLSWIFLALLITWSLAKALFPLETPGLTAMTYWWMGVVGMIGLLFSLIFHELSHSLVARRFGMMIRGITLFIFGGVAEMADEPPSAKAELWMALAGPAASLLISGLFGIIAALGSRLAWPEPILGVAGYLASINLLLAGFNLVPAYPLDGGRVLRAVLWWWKGDLRWATHRASQAGSAFAVLLMAGGVLQIVTGNFVGGMWWFLIGLFLRSAATGSYTQLIARDMLAGKPASDFMTPDPLAVPPNISVEAFVEDYIYRHHHEQFPVVEGDTLMGLAGIQQVKAMPREAWRHHTVGEIAVRTSNLNTVDADADATLALALMSRTGNSRLLVTRRGKLVGILTLKDLLRLLALHLKLDGSRP